jgi:cell division protein FtsL
MQRRGVTTKTRVVPGAITLLVAILVIAVALVWLKLWNRAVTALEDPSILEPTSPPEERAECKPGQSD